jgi:hypothetical protein
LNALPVTAIFRLFAAACAAVLARADPDAEVEGALQKLLDAPNYSWVTERRIGGPPSSSPRSVGSVSIQLAGRGGWEAMAEGQTERLGNTVIHGHWHPPGGDVVGTAAKSAKFNIVVDTPDGWLKPEELSVHFPRPRPAKLIEWKGQMVYLEDWFMAASAALGSKRPDEELPSLVGDIVTYRREGAVIVGELDEKGVSRLLPRQSKNGPQIRRGLVRFRLEGGELREYATYLIVESSSRPTKLGYPAPPLEQMLRCTTISGIGTTTVVLPSDAFDRLTP